MKISTFAMVLAASMAMYGPTTATTWTVGDCTYSYSGIHACLIPGEEGVEDITAGQFLYLAASLENNLPTSGYSQAWFLANDTTCGSDSGTCQGLAQLVVEDNPFGSCVINGVPTFFGLLWEYCGTSGGVVFLETSDGDSISVWAQLNSAYSQSCENEGIYTACVTCDGNCTV